MKKNLITAILMTIATTVLLGVIYPLVITALAQVLFRDKANGQILHRNGDAIGSLVIAQPFTSAKYFHPRPSNAGNGYDAANSGGTNYASTNQKLIDRVKADATTLHRPDRQIRGVRDRERRQRQLFAEQTEVFEQSRARSRAMMSQ